MAKTFGLKLPDVTPAQILALLTFIGGQAVAYGVLDANREKIFLSIASAVVAAAWKIADSIIRNGRAQIAAAQVTANKVIK